MIFKERNSMYVYKITNCINDKKYIGITNNYKKRWGNECSYPKDPKRRQVIQEAIHKYGKDNFVFEIIESGVSVEEAVELEQKYIILYNSLVPYGYNVDKGGDYHPHGNPLPGEKNGMAKITDSEAQYILDNRDLPLYVLYDEFSNKISYDEFKDIYNGRKFKHLTTETQIYPFNREFSSQFTSSKLDYDTVVSLRDRYERGEYWKEVYEDFKDLYSNPLSFWNVYNGRAYKLVKPEVFTEENKHKHSSLRCSGERNGRAKLTKDDVIKIRELHNLGVSDTKICFLYPQVSSVTVMSVINYKTWKNI